MTRLVVKSHHPWRRRALLGALAFAAVGIGTLLYRYGYSRAANDARDALAENVQLHVSAQKDSRMIADLREQKALAERSRQIEDQAYKQLAGSVADLQNEVAELKSELAFYRGIVSPKKASSGLRVENFEVTPVAVKNTYRYKLVLTQVLKNDTVARGEATFRIEGVKDGHVQVLQLKDVVPKGDGELNFRFKYFQNFEGDLVLPAGFVPSRVIVKVAPSGKRKSDIEETFEWPVEES